MEIKGIRNRRKKLPKTYEGLEVYVEERVFGGYGKEEMCRQIAELLYEELSLTTERIEQYYLPFGQAGFLTVRQKFERMLFLAAKRAPGNGRRQLFSMAGWDVAEKSEITAEDVETLYLKWCEEERTFLTPEEKQHFLTESLYEPFGYGILERLMEEETEGLCAGAVFDCGKEKAWETIRVLSGGRWIRLAFLAFENEAELCRVTKRLVCMSGTGELTVATPKLMWCCQDETRCVAVGPPAAESWGFAIYRDGKERESRK